MKKIELTQNQYAIIDDEDYKIICQYKWCISKGRNTNYAARYILIRSENKQKNIKNKRKAILMHRVIMEQIEKRRLEKNEHIDHINYNGLDNRKENLQIVTRSQHETRKQKKKNCTSQYKGVYWNKQHQKWHTRIKLNGKCIDLGLFNNEIEAAKVYDKAAKELFGSIGRLNFK